MRKSGIMLSEIGFANFPLLCKSAGLDFFIIDDEHGGFDDSDLAKIITVARLAGIAAIVRLPDCTRRLIAKAADMGADGFLLPMTGTPAQIAEVVSCAKYRPVGKRGISTMRAHTLYDPPELSAYTRAANARMKVYAQIETLDGMKNLADILAVEGVDGCFVGPNDLSDEMGCLGTTDGRILEAITAVGKIAARAKKTAGILTGNPTLLEHAKAHGYEMFSVGSELNAIAAYCKSIKSKIG